MGQRTYNFDVAMQLKDAGLIAATGNCQVAGADQIIDLGVGRFEGVCVIDVTALEVDTDNEAYEIILQGSNNATFAGTDAVNLAAMPLGSLEAIRGFVSTNFADSATGRYELAFTNEQVDTRFRYLRARVVVAGTIATGINFTAFVAPITWG